MSPVKPPTRYVSIHNHTTFSANDGIGYPEEHFNFCIENGLDAHAITDHGSLNSYAYAQLCVEDWAKKGKNFKYLPGIEAYYHPSLDQWRRDKEASVEEKSPKKRKKKQDEQETQISIVIDENDEPLDVDTTNALVIENEETSKNVRSLGTVNRRHHLVLLPKNSEGLREIFHLTSRSYTEGFYRFPRIDGKMIRETLTKGNVVASGACLAGFPSYAVFKVLEETKFDDLDPRLVDDKCVFDKCVTAVGNVYDEMVDLFGKDDYFLELQFNRIPAQDLVNRVILEFAIRNGLRDKLIATSDAHYYSPDLWRDREIYKRLAFMNYQDFSPDKLPKSREELRYELYPKNAQQMWQEFERARDRCDFYDDERATLVSQAIERGYDVAHEHIGKCVPDRSVKLPKKLIPPDKTPTQHLMKMCVEGLKRRGLKDKQEYIDRTRYEIGVIDKLTVAEYFVTMAKVIELAKTVCLVGPGRGSSGGSLVCYLLGITELDPIRWDLPFERFMSIHRKGYPDVDTDVGDRDKVLELLRAEFGTLNVAPISNYNMTKLRSLLKDLSKFYGIPFDEANAATRTVEHEVRKATTKAGDDKNLFVLTYEDAMQHSPTFKAFIEKYPQVGESMNVLFKQLRSLGRHAGGVLIADDLAKKMPLITSHGEVQTPWTEGVNVKHLEKIGMFLKIDLLGLQTLRLIEKTIENIIKRDYIDIQTETETVRLRRGIHVQLSSGKFVSVEELKPDDDIVMPVVTM